MADGIERLVAPTERVRRGEGTRMMDDLLAAGVTGGRSKVLRVEGGRLGWWRTRRRLRRRYGIAATHLGGTEWRLWLADPGTGSRRRAALVDPVRARASRSCRRRHRR